MPVRVFVPQRTLGYHEGAAQRLGAALGRVMLVSLEPRSRVYSHVDRGAYYAVRDRLHLVLSAASRSLLCVGGRCAEFRVSDRLYGAIPRSPQWRHPMFALMEPLRHC